MNVISMRKRFGKWLFVFGLWALIVLLFSTRTPPPGLNRSWLEMLKFTAGDWFIWVLSVPAIIRLDRRLPVIRDAFLQRFLYHIPLSVLVTTVCIMLRWVIMYVLGFSFMLGFSVEIDRAIGDPLFSFAILRESWRGIFHIYLLIYWAIVGIHLAYNYSNLLKDREKSFFEARLNTLRSQMHPHFLFNALNTISAHVESNPRTACRMLEQLAELLRFSLDYSEEQKIPLADEISFINRYLDLQKARYRNRLEIKMAVDPGTLHAMVPTFILEPLVENAIVHGIAPRFKKGTVEIHAQREKERLHLIVKDDGLGLPPGWNVDQQSAGIGINNTCERLCCLYKAENFVFSIANAEGGGVQVEIDLPFQPADNLSEGELGYAKNSRVHCG